MNLQGNPNQKIELHYRVVGSGKELTILIDRESTVNEVLQTLVALKLIPIDDYSKYSLQNKRTNSFLSNVTLHEAGVKDGDTIWVFPPLGKV